MQVFSNTFCLLSEGPLWHPERCELFWFDISSKKLFQKERLNVFRLLMRCYLPLDGLIMIHC